MDRRAQLVEYLKDSCPGFSSDNGKILDHLDSMAMISLVTFLGAELGVELDMSDFDLDHFQTVDTLLAALEKHGRTR